jgi:predicted Zn-dependent protease
MKTKLRKLLIITCVLAILGGGGFGAYRGYKAARQTRLLRQARTFLAQPDERKALLSLQRALNYNPRDAEACRLMAQLSEAARSPSSLLWRAKVVEIKPHSLSDRLALVQTALVLRDYASATNALAGVDAAGKVTAAYHNIAGSLASTLNRLDEAEAHFVEASRLEPQNLVPQLNLAIVRLHGTNTTALAEARATLKVLSSNSTNSTLRCQALRELASDALEHKQAAAALELTKELLQQTNSIFADRLLRLDVLKETHSPDFKTSLVDFQNEAVGTPGKIYELIMWQMAKTSPKEALAWLKTLPMNTQTGQPAALLEAECYALMADWSGLQAWLQPTNQPQYWGELEFVRHAFLTRALRELQLSGAAKAEWEQALKAASAQKGSQVMLLRLAAQWKWQTEAEELLWAIVTRYPTENWAVQSLTQALYAGGRTRSLMMLFSQQSKTTPSDLGVKNNLALVALLLDAQEIKPHELAREAYQKFPTNAAFASTYAFSLYMQKNPVEALKILERLSPQDLSNPSIAGYYGIILKANSNDAKAQPYLNWASKGPMLPEERKLFERAKSGS